MYYFKNLNFSFNVALNKLSWNTIKATKLNCGHYHVALFVILLCKKIWLLIAFNLHFNISFFIADFNMKESDILQSLYHLHLHFKIQGPVYKLQISVNCRISCSKLINLKHKNHIQCRCIYINQASYSTLIIKRVSPRDKIPLFE